MQRSRVSPYFPRIERDHKSRTEKRKEKSLIAYYCCALCCLKLSRHFVQCRATDPGVRARVIASGVFHCLHVFLLSNAFFTIDFCLRAGFAVFMKVKCNHVFGHIEWTL